MNKRGQQSAAADATRGDDRELVDAARAGDRNAFRILFERYQRRAYALAYGVVRNPDDALDVVQDAFIKAHRYLDKFEGTSSFYTWLYRIVMNLAIDHIRKAKRGRAVDFNDQTVREEDGRVGEDDLLPRILGAHPGRALADKEIRRRIEEALAELSDNHRAVLVMRELDGLSYEEMAQVMGCSKGTIMSRLFHARKNMQRRLLDLYEHPPAELLAELQGKEGGKDGGKDGGKGGGGKAGAGKAAEPGDPEGESGADLESAGAVETSGRSRVKDSTR